MGKQKRGREKCRNRQPQPDGRRDWLVYQERRGRTRTTPRQMQQRDPQPWYLPELGLKRDCYVERVPRYEPGPVIRGRSSGNTSEAGSTVAACSPG